MVNLVPNIKNFNVDGIPPGLKAVEFNSTAMWNEVNLFKEINTPKMGAEHTDYQLTASFLKGLGVNMTVADLDKRIELDATNRTMDLATRGVRSELSGRISGVQDDGRELGNAAVATVQPNLTKSEGLNV